MEPATSESDATVTEPVVYTRLVYQDDYVEVFLRDAVSELTLVTFSPIGIYANGMRYWAQPVADNLNLRCIGIISKGNTFFPEISFANMLSAIGGLLTNRVLVYGSSMGAYAAIRYSRRLRADAVIAFSPLTTISPIVLPGNLYVQHYIPSLHADMQIKSDDMVYQTYIFTDPLYAEDRRQIELIPDEGKLRIVPVRSLRHNTNFLVVGTSVMRNLITCCLADDQPGAVSIIRKAKRAHPATYYNLSLHLLDRRKERWAARAIGHAQMIGPAEYQIIHYAMHKSEILEADGHQEEAIKLLQGLATSLQDQEDIKIRLGQLFSSARRYPEAADAYATAILCGGKKPAVYHGYVHAALMSGRRAEALPLVLRGIELCPTDATLPDLKVILKK